MNIDVARVLGQRRAVRRHGESLERRLEHEADTRDDVKDSLIYRQGSASIRTSPNSAGEPPSQCCSKVALKRCTNSRPYTASVTVNRPVDLLQPRPEPEKSSPGVDIS